MKIVIDIPEKTVNEIKDNVMFADNISSDIRWGITSAIVNGTPLPKEHGRLIDADSLIKAIEEKAKRLSNADTINGLCGAVALIFDEQAIIEADKESD